MGARRARLGSVGSDGVVRRLRLFTAVSASGGRMHRAAERTSDSTKTRDRARQQGCNGGRLGFGGCSGKPRRLTGEAPDGVRLNGKSAHAPPEGFVVAGRPGSVYFQAAGCSRDGLTRPRRRHPWALRSAVWCWCAGAAGWMGG